MVLKFQNIKFRVRSGSLQWLVAASFSLSIPPPLSTRSAAREAHEEPVRAR